jgi:hypothetical protein
MRVLLSGEVDAGHYIPSILLSRDCSIVQGQYAHIKSGIS